MNNIGVGAKGHVQEFRNHETEGFRVLLLANRKVISSNWAFTHIFSIKILCLTIHLYLDFVRKWTFEFNWFFKHLTTGDVRTISPIELNRTTNIFNGFCMSVKLKKLS